MDEIYPHGTTIKDTLDSPGGDFRSIGKSKTKADAVDKALGRIQFTDDIQLPGMLHCKIKRSTKAHAKILSVDVSKATKMDGVYAVITGQDFHVKYGVIPWTKDEYPLAREKVRYIGEGVAAVAAVDEETANAACKRIVVEYEEMEVVLNPDNGLPREGGDPLNRMDSRLNRERPEREEDQVIVNDKARVGNITKHVALEFGDVEKGFESSKHVVESDFYFPNTTHAAIEPHCAIGDYRPNGQLTLYSTTQVPHYLHRTLSEVLDLPTYRIRVIQPPVGGAFGGKSECFDLEFVVGLLSMQTGRPVKCLYTREEVFYAHRGRHPMWMKFKTGVDAEGIIQAVDTNIQIDGGAYASFGLVTAFYAGQLLTGPVGMKNYRLDTTRYYTNKPACGPKRGHGSVQPRFAFEVQLDELAEKLKMDPIDLRIKNFVGENTETINGQRINSLGLKECLDAVRSASKWDERRGKLPYGRGLGVASSMYISGTNYPVYPNEMPQSAINLKADRSGKITIFSGASDIGQGCNSMLASIISEELGVDESHIQVIASDTDLTPVDLGAYSSRVTLMLGHAALEAGRKLRGDIQTSVAHFWNQDDKSIGISKGQCEQGDVVLHDNQAIYQRDTELRMDIQSALQVTESRFGSLNYSGSYRTKKRGGDYRGGTIGSSPAYSCTAHIADVEVDQRTGMVKIHKIWVAHDCGRAINPMLVKGQMEGSTYMGAAEVFMEEMKYGEDPVRKGMLVGPNLLDYRIPTSMDTPEIEAIIVERPDANGPYGAKEAGEGPLHSSIPAVVNAIYDAIGVRFRKLPIGPEDILNHCHPVCETITPKAGSALSTGPSEPEKC